MHPLIIIGVFVYEFLSIHPYQDGNGRLSRLLTNFLLLKTDYKFVLYVSLEHIVESRKKDYYKALMQGQKDRNKPTERINEWLLFFLESLEELITKLEKKLTNFKEIGGYLNERQKEIISYIQENQPVKISNISNSFTQHNIATIRKDLKYLVSVFEIEKIGENKGVIYIIKSKS